MPEEVVDALVLAARFDEQGLAASERAIINRLESISAATARLGASGQVGPFRDLSRDIVAATGALRRGELSLEGYNVALQHARLELIALRQAGYEPNAKQLDVLNQAIDRTTASLARQAGAAKGAALASKGVHEQLGLIARGSDSAQAGAARARAGLAQLAVTSIGTSAAVGQVAQGLLFIGGLGTTGIIAAALGVAVLGKAYDLVTANARKAREEQEKLLAAQRQRLTTSGGDEGELQRTIAADKARILTTTREIAQWEKAIVEDAIRGVPVYLEVLKLRKLIAEQRRLELALAADTAALDQKHADEIFAVLQRQKAQQLQSITAAPALGTADAGTFRAIRAEMARQLEIIRAEGVALVDRNEAQVTYNNLLEALLVPRREAEARALAEAAAVEASVAAAAAFLDTLTKINVEAAALQAKSRKGLITFLESGQQSAIDKAFTRATQEAKKLVTPADQAADAAERMAQGFDQAAGAVAAFRAIGDAFGVLDERSAAVLSNIEGIFAAAASGNIFGAIVGGAGFLGAALGPDAGDQEQKRLTKENSDRLQELAAALDRVDFGVAGTARAGQAAGELAARGIEGTVRAAQFGLGDIERGAAILAQAARDAGSSLSDLQAIAKENGIKLLDDKGRLVAGALQDLADAAGFSIEAMTSFGKSFEEQARAADLRSQLAGEAQDAAAQFARELATASRFSPAIQQAFQGVDLGDKNAVREAALRLFDQFQAGFFAAHPELFGDISKEDFLDFLGGAADSLNDLSDAANDLAKGMSNIPDTFKLAQAEWAARAIDVVATAPIGPPLRGIDINPRVGTAAVGPTTSITGNTFVFPITAPANMSPGDLARRVKGEFDAEVQANFGLAPPP